MESIIAINILVGDILINPSNQPILFYWDGKNNIKDIIFETDSLLKIIDKHIINFNDYITTKIYFCGYYNDNTLYKEDFVYLSDIYTIDKFSCNIYLELVYPIFTYLYSQAYKTEYTETLLQLNEEDGIVDIYNKLKDKFTNKITSKTIINYIKSKLDKNEFLSIENKNIIISYLNELFNKNETE